MKDTKYVGLDQHKDTIVVATARYGRGKPALYGEIESSAASVLDLADRLDDGESDLRFCYEAGTCGYGV